MLQNKKKNGTKLNYFQKTLFFYPEKYNKTLIDLNNKIKHIRG